MCVKKKSYDWLDLFSGGVPTAPFFFSYTLDGLEKLYLTQSDKRGGRQLNELCAIGLVAYFEAFCKDHFASIINIEPSLLKNLSKMGRILILTQLKHLN